MAEHLLHGAKVPRRLQHVRRERVAQHVRVHVAREREDADRDILAWAGGLNDAWLASTLEYRASSDGKLRRLPAWIAATHLFQHATHHRGQVTTLMKQAGVDPGVTDLPYLPGVVRLVD